jgi:hypothetical protein
VAEDGVLVGFCNSPKTCRWELLTPNRPKEFHKSNAAYEDSDDEESTVGKMPPSESDEE